MKSLLIPSAVLTAAAMLQGQSMSDQQFVDKAAQVNMTEAHVGQMAQQKGTTDDVRQYGQKLESDHKDANGKLKEAAGSLMLPQAIDSEHQQEIKRLEPLSGKEFDTQFRQAMVQGHQKVIDMFQRAQSEVANPQLKNYIAGQLPVLRGHLQAAQNLGGHSKTQSGMTQSGSSGMKNTKAQQSEAVNNLLHATNQARDAISNKNGQGAKNHIQQALNAADKLSAAAAGETYIPLYTEISRYSVLGPIEAALKRTGNQSAAENQSKNDRDAGAKQQQSPADTPSPTVQRVVGEYTSVGIDLNQAKTHLQAAKEAIARDDMKAADMALGAVQSSVSMTSISSDMPLLRARENLILARAAASKNDYDQARSALNAASKSLSNYEQASGKFASDAKTLRSEIDTYSKSVSKDSKDLGDRIESWWDKTTDWMTPGDQASSDKSTSSRR